MESRAWESAVRIRFSTRHAREKERLVSRRNRASSFGMTSWRRAFLVYSVDWLLASSLQGIWRRVRYAVISSLEKSSRGRTTVKPLAHVETGAMP